MTISASAGILRSTRHRLDDADRGAGKAARNGHLVLINGQFLRTSEQHDRRAADDDCAGHRLPCASDIFANADSRRRRPDARPCVRPAGPVRLQRAAIGPHVLDAAFRIAGDAQCCSEVRRGVRNPASKSARAIEQDRRPAAADPAP